MFETFGSQNLQIQRDLAVRYNVNARSEEEGGGYDVMRVATMQYSFVGMTRAAAKACADAKVAKYTRKYAAGNDEFVNKLMADISSIHVAGHMYQVDVSVNEQETLYARFPPSNLAAMFPVREYDGIESGDVINLGYSIDSTVGKFFVWASSNIEGFNENQMTVQYKTAQGFWADLGVGIGPYEFKASSFFIRAKFGSVYSAEVEVVNG